MPGDPRVAELERAAENARGDSVAALEATATLAVALADEDVSVRRTAAALLADNPHSDIYLPALTAALERAIADVRRVVVARLYVYRRKGGRLFDLCGEPYQETGELISAEEQPLFLFGLHYASTLIDALARCRDDRAVAALVALSAGFEPEDTPATLWNETLAGLLRAGTRSALAEAVAAYGRIEKFVLLPEERRPLVATTQQLTPQGLVARRATPLVTEDRSRLHAALVAAFERAGAKRTPKLPAKGRARTSRAWKSALKRIAKDLPESVESGDGKQS